MNDYSPGRAGDHDLCTPVLQLRTIILLGYLATSICAPLSYNYERLFVWTTWRPGFMRPSPITERLFAWAFGDQDLCTPFLQQ